MRNINKNSLVSVIIPTYGADYSLIASITSIINQSYKNIEIIVVDDNGFGTENQIKTNELLFNFIKKGEVKYYPLEKNSNASVARNRGFSLSSGDYIAFLDDDDIYSKDKIRIMMQEFGELDPSWGMAYCSYEKFKDDVLLEEVNADKSGQILFNILIHQPSATSGSLLIRRDVYERLNGFDETFSRHQDWEFTARIASLYKVKGVNHVGLRKNMVLRNTPIQSETILKNREKYLDTVLLYSKGITKTEYEIATIYNIIEGVTGFLRERKLILFFNNISRLLDKYVPDYSKRNLIKAISLKIVNKLYRIRLKLAYSYRKKNV